MTETCGDCKWWGRESLLKPGIARCFHSRAVGLDLPLYTADEWTCGDHLPFRAPTHQPKEPTDAG